MKVLKVSKVRKILFLAACFSLGNPLQADMHDTCSDLYVHQVSVNPDGGSWVSFKESQNDGQDKASKAVNFNGWSEKDRKSAFSLVLVALSSGKQVDIQTNVTGGCGITQQSRTLRYITLSASK